MSSTPHVAWLRGINVGGNNRILMADLRAVFAGAGFGTVATYIQSGNVVFTAPQQAIGAIESKIEAALLARFASPIPVVVRSRSQLADVITAAPPGFGTEPTIYHDDVWFLKGPVTGDDAIAHLDPRPGVDEVWPGSGVVYTRRLSARRAQSKLARVVGTPVYRSVTVRNWATTTRVMAMLHDMAP